jgi:hypothetical protein
MRRGRYNPQRGQVVGESDGLPVATAQGCYEIPLSVDEVQAIAPEAIRDLEIGGSGIELSYWVPAYVIHPDINEYQEALFMAVVHKNADDPLISANYFIYEDDDGTFKSNIDPEYRREPLPSVADITPEELEEETGINIDTRSIGRQFHKSSMSRRENEAINKLLDAIEAGRQV